MVGERRLPRRPLTSEERALWEAVAKTASPLKPKKARRKKPSAKVDNSPQPADLPAAGPAPVAQPQRRTPGPPAPAAAPAPRRPPPPEAIDRRTTSRVARGSIGLDGRIDLHGFTQDEAYRRLLVFLHEVQRRRGRMVLVITGKGSDAGRLERGVLRRMVPQWLGSAAFRPLVAAYDDAHRLHGGGGALYVRIRKA